MVKVKAGAGLPVSGSRRKWLQGVGSITLVMVGGTVWRMHDQGVFSTGNGPAYEAWKTWRTDTAEGSVALVRAAILAANPHNTQPWRFQISESRIDLFADTTRNIGAIDPDLREMYIGLGCALENLILAAGANGFQAKLTMQPNLSDPTHAARVELSRSTPTPSALYEVIPRRHTNRGPYDTNRALSAEVLRQIQQLGAGLSDLSVFWFTSDEQRTRIGDWMIRATEAVIADAKQAEDSGRWMRDSWQAIQERKDGITIDAQGLPDFIRAAAKTLPPFSQEQNDQAWLKNTRDTYVARSNAFGIIAVRDSRSASQRMLGGRFWQRLHLWGTLNGLGMQPLNQMAERADREVQLAVTPEFGGALKSLIELAGGDAGWQALMPFRIGYPLSAALPSPRRNIKDVMR